MRPPVLLTLLLAAGCGDDSTRPAECRAFLDAFNEAMTQVRIATGEGGSGGDIAKMAATMKQMDGIYAGLEKEIAGQPIQDEQLRLRVESYLAVVKDTRRTAGIIAGAAPGSPEVYRINEAQMRLKDLGRKERSTVAEITEYCGISP